jgi:dTDP-4-amino-4,6-dideoxygalactose transaminase
MLKAVHDSALQFYEVDSQLHISGDWLDDVGSGDLVVFIDYFGFPFDSALAAHVRHRRAWVLEDASQALLSPYVGKSSDFVIFSPRKFLGIPDGGILRYRGRNKISRPPLESPPAKWWLGALNAAILRREFDLYGRERSWFQLFQQLDKKSPIGPYGMSALSRAMLERSFDYSSIVRQRIENYRTLNDQLRKFAVFPELPEDVVPLGYPIRLANRDELRQRLFDHNIYPPVHWPIKGNVPRGFVESHRLADTILTLVCDQRYGAVDMERTGRIVSRFAQSI